jgi:hypothetical protein
MWPLLGGYDMDALENTDVIGTGTYQFLTVPVGEVWRIFMIYIQKSSGTVTFGGLRLKGPTTAALQFYVQTAATTVLHTLNPSLWLPAGWGILVDVSTYASGAEGDFRSYVQKFKQVTPPVL